MNNTGEGLTTAIEIPLILLHVLILDQIMTNHEQNGAVTPNVI